MNRPGLVSLEWCGHVAREVHRRVRDLAVEGADGRAVLRGRSASYHVKQLAQEALLKVLPPGWRLENRIEVGEPVPLPVATAGRWLRSRRIVGRPLLVRHGSDFSDRALRERSRLGTVDNILSEIEAPPIPVEGTPMDPKAELLELTHALLNCIGRGDWAMYRDLCDDELTAFEPEAHGVLVEGLQFHYFNMDMADRAAKHQTNVITPKIRVMENVGVVAYVRVNQCATEDGRIRSESFAETRVWEKKGDRWRCVHFHRTALS